MADGYTYQKKRKEFGRHAQFEDTDTKIVGSIPPDPNQPTKFIPRDPNKVVLSNIPQLSQHSVNTERIPIAAKGMKHQEGGWPAHIDPTEPADQAKYAKQMYRDTTLGFSQATKEMCQGVTKCIRQNNEIDLFEEYFAGETAEHINENITTKTLMIFKDPNSIKRAVTSIAWHPDTSADLRVGVTYAMLRFQQMPKDMPKESYIWNLNNPNFPEKTLSAPSPLCSMAFNHKHNDIIVGGSYNGSLSFFDVRQGSSSGVIKPMKTTILEQSHHDPVYDVQWLTHEKSGTKCASSSTDGRIHWWDYNFIKEETPAVPSETFMMEEKVPINKETGETKLKLLGGTSLEYSQEAGPMKYLIGTEQGYILQANKRPGKPVEIMSKFGFDNGKHHGPVYSLWRNPGHIKYFLSVGDWSAKIWFDELVQPIMQTRYHQAYLTDGYWSPQRYGLFYLTRIDGFLDVWDFYYRQNEVAYSQKISDSPLTSIKVNLDMAAIGDAEGTVSIMKLSPPLYETTPKEKEVMQQIFEREARREKGLWLTNKLAKEAEEKAKDPKAKQKEDPVKLAQEKKEKMDKEIQSIEENFFKKVASDEYDVDQIKARGDLVNAEAAAKEQAEKQ